ncbi:MAG: ABC transporter permease [Anaerolineae bacterium]
MMEMFLTSARPTEMLWGKVLGLGALGITQLLIWGGIGLGITAAQGTLDIQRTLANYSITPSYILLLLVFFLLGYLIYGTLMAGLAALVNAEQEGRQYAGIFSLLLMVPIFFIVQFLQSPNTGTPRFLSLFPLTSPTAMIMRASWGTVDAGEIALSIGLLIVSIIAIIWIAARLMRLGMLNYGKKLGPREIIRGLLEGRTIVTARDQKESEVTA